MLATLLISATAITSLAAIAAPAAQAEYVSNWKGKVANGVQLEDTDPPWEHGGYHLWTYGDVEHPGSPVKKLCFWAWTGSKWESGSKCEENEQFIATGFPGQNALALVQGWATSGSLTMLASVGG